MACKHDWTIEFDDLGLGNRFEIRPYSMEFHDSRKQYCYLRSRFPWEVGEELKEMTRDIDSSLNGFSTANVLFNGRRIKQLLFRPDYVRFGHDYTQLELHDLKKSLSAGTVNMQRKRINIEKIYKEIFNQCSNNIISSIRFSDNVESDREIFGSTLPAVDYYIQETEDSEISDSGLAVDFEKVSPEVAIEKLNQYFGFHSWVNENGHLVVGKPTDTGITHLAAPNDTRVWKYNNVQTRHNREPVKRVIVEGPWVNKGGIERDIPSATDNDREEVLAYGIAERTDVDSGTEKTFVSRSANPDTIGWIAKNKLEAQFDQETKSSIDIMPAHSGSEVSDLIDVQPGDFIQLVPDDKHYDRITPETGSIYDEVDNKDHQCGAIVNNDYYNITDVKHSVSDMGYWEVSLEADLYVDFPIDYYITYYHPQKERFLTNEEFEETIVKEDRF